MGKANDYDPVADLYDAYVRVGFDLEFFQAQAAAAKESVLELMAGTGRVTRGLHRGNHRVTCVDLSLGMLQVLQRNLADLTPAPRVVCADICRLPLRRRYELAVIPFHSLAELTSAEDRASALCEVRRVLLPAGRLICTLHNPTIRGRSLDGRRRSLGRFDLTEGRQLELWVEGTVDESTGLAQSVQTYRVFDARGELERELVQELQFALIAPERFRETVTSLGFRVASVFGDYRGTAFDPAESPYMIWILQLRE